MKTNLSSTMQHKQITNLLNNILIQDLNICRGVHKSIVTWAGFL